MATRSTNSRRARSVHSARSRAESIDGAIAYCLPLTEMADSSGSPIDRVEVLALGPDLPRHAYTAHLPAPYTTSTLVRITDADGAQGLGQFDSDSYGAFDLAPLETLRTLAPRLIGRDPLDRVATWDDLRDHGTAPDMPGVRSALDIAQWDLVARRAGVPLHELIAPRPAGAVPERLPAYASLPTLASPAAYAEDVARYRPRATRAFKIHAWGDAERDLDAIRAAREVAGDDVALIYDAEGCFDRPTAERMMPALGDLGVRWFEAPLPDLDLEGYRRLMRLGGVAIVPAGDAIWDERLMPRDPARSAVVRDAVRRDVRRRHHVGDQAVRRRGGVRDGRRGDELRPDPGAVGEPARDARVRQDQLLRAGGAVGGVRVRRDDADHDGRRRDGRRRSTRPA